MPEPLIPIEKNELGVSYARIRAIFIFGSAARATRGRMPLCQGWCGKGFRESRRCIEASELLRQFGSSLISVHAFSTSNSYRLTLTGGACTVSGNSACSVSTILT